MQSLAYIPKKCMTTGEDAGMSANKSVDSQTKKLKINLPDILITILNIKTQFAIIKQTNSHLRLSND